MVIHQQDLLENPEQEEVLMAIQHPDLLEKSEQKEVQMVISLNE